MPAGSTTSYNPYDATQAAFLSALAQGEVGSAPNGYTLGVGGTDLSGVTQTDAYGFPTWGGFGNSHAAGEFQFQPATWDAEAQALGFTSFSAANQNAAAWDLAQKTYTAKTGGSLSDALASGDYTGIQTALAGVWPSVTGNGASPGLASLLSSGGGATLDSGAAPVSADTSSGGLLTSILGGNPFVRIGLLVVGALILLVALWKLLSDTGAVPSPGDTVRVAGKAAAAAL